MMMSRRPHQSLVGITALALLAACGDAIVPPNAAPPNARAAIADARSGFVGGFYWQQPIMPSARNGTFDATLAPVVTVCEVVSDSCGPTVVTFTMNTGDGSEVVRVDPISEHYIVNFHTDHFALSTSKAYRIEVGAGANARLGFADLVLLDKSMRNTRTNENIELLNGRTLPIKFRIEQGAVASVAITPASGTLNVGQSLALTATVTDLHGATITTPVSWTSSATGVATVSSSGVVTGAGAGLATISATAGGMSATATVQVSDGLRFGQISGGIHNTCAVATSGQLYCWGGWVVTPFSGADVPYAIPAATAARSVSVGTFHSCYVTTSGAGLCQGGAGLWGNGTMDESFPYVPVSGGLTFTQITTGFNHSCGLTQAGAAYCWGNNFWASLGNGTSSSTYATTPEPVVGGHTFTRLVSGLRWAMHTCGLKASGEVWCWGQGYGLVPTRIGPALLFSKLASGDGTVCGISNGAAYCMGSNSEGQLGDGTYTARAALTPVVGNHTFTEIAVGLAHTCAIDTAGDTWCWGQNYRGNLGNGEFGTNLNTPVKVLGGHVFTTLGLGADHSCGITAAGQAWCWGKGDLGQLGNGLSTNTNVPVAVSQQP